MYSASLKIFAAVAWVIATATQAAAQGAAKVAKAEGVAVNQLINVAVAERERAAAEMHQVVDRYMELTLAQALLENAAKKK